MADYIFDPQVVHECATSMIGRRKPEMFEVFHEEMSLHYPGLLDDSQPWVYSIAGGSLIQMKMFYASFNEYVMIWGTPIGSSGFSGRHVTGFWDTVVEGEMRYFGEGRFDASVYRPGDQVYVGPGQARAMNFRDGVYAVEYARGPIAASVPFGMADVLFSCWDFVTAAQTLTMYTDLTMQHVARTMPRLRPFASALARGASALTHRLEPPAEVGSVMPRENTRYFRRRGEPTVVRPGVDFGVREASTEPTGFER